MIATLNGHGNYSPSLIADTFSPASPRQTYCLYTVCGVDVRGAELSKGEASKLIDNARGGRAKHVRVALSELAGAVVSKGDVHRNYRGETGPAGNSIGIDEKPSAEVLSMAVMLATESNEGIELARELRRRVIEYGGISGSAYERIPNHYRRRDGQALDCLATELGYSNEDALWLEIQAAENVLRRLPVVNGKRLQKFRAKDMLQEAEALLLSVDEDDRDIPF